MGKNQGYKAQQRVKHNASDGPGGGEQAADGMVDASFHTPEWHAARVAALQVERMTWEEWKKKQKEEKEKEDLVARTEEEKMREYRAQLDADRAKRLGGGSKAEEDQAKRKRKHKSKDKKKKREKEKEKAKEKKDKAKKGTKKKKRKRSSSSGTSSDDLCERSPGPNEAFRLSKFLKR